MTLSGSVVDWEEIMELHDYPQEAEVTNIGMSGKDNGSDRELRKTLTTVESRPPTRQDKSQDPRKLSRSRDRRRRAPIWLRTRGNQEIKGQGIHCREQDDEGNQEVKRMRHTQILVATTSKSRAEGVKDGTPIEKCECTSGRGPNHTREPGTKRSTE